MAKLKRGRVNRLILDIGSSAVRLCELTQTKTGFQLTRYVQREVLTEPEADEETKKKLRIDAITDILKTSKARGKKVVFGVPGQSVFTRTRALPPVQEYKVTQIVQYEIRQQIPFALDQIALDYQVLSRTEAGGYEVLMAAITVVVVEKQLELLKAIKRQPDVVDICPVAAYNWLKFAGEFGDQGECICLIDMGASTTDLVFERGGQFRFTRSLNMGGNDITSAVSKALNISFVEAEKMKRERAFAPTGDPQRDARAGEIVGQPLQRLVTEITRSFAYFRSQPGGGPVSRVILTGGGACLRNIVPYLQRQLGVEVRIAHPLAGLAIGPGAQEVNERPEQAATVLGLALRVSQSVPIEINLIPPRIREAARQREQAFYWLMVLVTFGLIMASIIPLQAKKDEAVKKQIAEYEKVLRQYDNAIPLDETKGPGKSKFEDENSRIESQRTQLEAKLKILDKSVTERRAWLKYLQVISNALPPKVVLSTIETTTIVESKVAAGTAQRRSGFSGGSRKAARDADPNANTGPSGPSGLMGAGASSPVQINNNFASNGFPAIAPRVTSGPLTGAAPVEETAELPAPPNGIAIIGYAQTPELIDQFVSTLKLSPLFGSNPDNVIYEDKNVKEVPATTLDEAGGAVATAMDVTDPAMMDDERERSRGAFQRDSSSSFNSATPFAAQSGEPPWLSFRVDVRFADNAAPEAAPPAPSAGTKTASAAAPAGGGK